MAPSSFTFPLLPPASGESVDSPLRRLDPRVKLLLLPMLTMSVFAAASLPRLLLLLGTAVLLALLSRLPLGQFWRPLYLLRWLFFATLLLHLFFTPGHTLWGLAWLSLDGLLAGLLICLRLALAVVFSSLLTMTTAPEELVGGGVSLLSPLRRCGLPVERGGALLLLVLRFIPLLAEEVVRLLGTEKASRPVSWAGRLKALLDFLEELLLRLLQRAEELALARLAEPPPVSGGAAARGMGAADRLTLLGGLGFVLFISVPWL
jgi:energy-coupling factor transport system permease protein